MEDPNNDVFFCVTRAEAGWMLHSIDLYYARCREAHFDSAVKILDIITNKLIAQMNIVKTTRQNKPFLVKKS
jgi:hypothetical protein